MGGVAVVPSTWRSTILFGVTIDLDVIIFGGGCAGLWLADELRRGGWRVLLLEADRLGSGQTVAAQGIIHGGLKYTLKGSLTASARAIRTMPELWRRCLAGEAEPNLSATKMRGDFCYLWHTQSLRSKAGMIGARIGLKVKPVLLPQNERPAPLAGVKGSVYQLNEQVIDTVSFLTAIAARNKAHLLRIDASSGLRFENGESGVSEIRLTDALSKSELTLRATHIVFAAGAGNEALRKRAGLTTDAMQRRPLHMVMVRGPLPMLNGHCVDGSTTRVTITANQDGAGRVVWQLGGQIAEQGVALEREALIDLAKSELAAVLPGFDAEGLEWATYRVDRAEGAMARGARPEDVQVVRDGNVWTCWPTKMALAPVLAQRVVSEMELPGRGSGGGDDAYLGRIQDMNWPRPQVAAPPWEAATWSAGR